MTSLRMLRTLTRRRVSEKMQVKETHGAIVSILLTKRVKSERKKEKKEREKKRKKKKKEKKKRRKGAATCSIGCLYGLE